MDAKPEEQFDLKAFKEYVNSYEIGSLPVISIQHDMIYGIGIATDVNFMWADGYDRFKAVLTERWNPEQSAHLTRLRELLERCRYFIIENCGEHGQCNIPSHIQLLTDIRSALSKPEEPKP